MVNRFVDIGRKYGMEINIDKSQVMRLSRSNESLQIKVGNRQLKELDHCKYLGSVLRTDGYCKMEIKNCHGQKSILEKNITLDKEDKY